MPICVDASLLVKLFLTEPDRHLVEELWGRWAAGDDTVLAPPLLDYEVASVLRLQAFRGAMSPPLCRQRLQEYTLLDIPKEHDEALIVRALEIAAELGQPRAYDGAYIAVAERFDAPLWTADARLWNSAHGRFPFVRLLGTS